MKRYFVYGSHPESGGWADFYAEFDCELDAKIHALDMLEKGCDVTLMDGYLKTSKHLKLGYDGRGRS